MNSMNRRKFLAGMSGFTMFALYPLYPVKSPDESKQIQPMEPYDMELRPHHILDIISDYGQGIEYQPHPYGHSLHIIAPELLSNLDLEIKLVLKADDICRGCEHLMPDSTCDDVLAQLNPSPSKQAYNDVLDCRLFDCFSTDVGSIMTVRSFFEMVNAKVPGIEKICTHPKENQEERLKGLINGLIKSGIREQT